MRKNQNGDALVQLLAVILMAAVVFGGIGGCMWLYPKYNVYSQRMAGSAELQRADSNRQIAVREAEARRDSAVADAEAERTRAQGVADANKIVADSLGGPEGYLRYLAIDAMKSQAGSARTTVYIPTDANIPITEASRFNKPTAGTSAQEN